MSAGYRSSASSGGSQFTTTASVPVPTGAIADDVVLAFLTRWSGGGFPAITAPSGFQQITLVTVGQNEFSAWWKRLSGSDSGPYVFSWDGSLIWNHADAVALTGVPTTGNPVDDFATANNSGSIYPDVTVTASDAADLLIWHGSSQSVGTHTPPTGFTEVVDAETDATAYRTAGATGDHTATGATSTATNPNIAFLAAVLAAPVGQTITLSIADAVVTTDTTARTHTLVLDDAVGATDIATVSSGSSAVRHADLSAQNRLAAAVATPGRLSAALEEQP